MIAEIEPQNGHETFRKVGLGYEWNHESYPVRFTADSIRERSEEITAEIVIEDVREDKPRHLAMHRTNLMSLSTRRNLSRDMEDQCRDDGVMRKVPWKDVIEQFCMGVIKRCREGEPLVHVETIKQASKKKDLIEKVLTAGKPTLWYGPQGAGKGWLCVGAAVAVASGTPFAGLHVGIPVPVMYLDWEDSEDTFHDRVDAVINGIPSYTGGYPPVYYRKMRGQLPRQIPRVLRDIEALHIGLVIVDSVGLAMGAKADGGASYEDQAIAFFEAVRFLEPAAVLLVDHVTGESVTNGKLAGKAFGSIYKMAEARAAWEVRKEQDTDSDEQLVGLHHTKHNHTRKFPSIGIKLTFDNDEDTLVAVTMKQSDIKESVELVKQLSQKDQIEAHLLKEGASSLDQIAEAIDVGRDVTRAQLNQMAKKNRAVKLPDGRWGIPSNKPVAYLKPLP